MPIFAIICNVCSLYNNLWRFLGILTFAAFFEFFPLSSILYIIRRQAANSWFIGDLLFSVGTSPYFGFDGNMSAARKPKVSAAVIPPDEAVSPPVSAPTMPFSFTALTTPLARV